ncbi:hypothetical protein ACEPPN_006188 [Leptodophora sp. 'Broadleaf-Isolate-01']
MGTLESVIEDHDIELMKKIMRSTPLPSQRELDTALALAVDPDPGLPETIVPLFQGCARITKSVFEDAASMLNYGWDINSVEFRQTGLRLAVGGEAHAKWVLDHGADPNVIGKQASPLATAALEPLSRVLDILISHGADLDPYTLFKAMIPRGRGRIPVMKYLIDHGIDINAVRPKYGAPLHYAVTLGMMTKERLELLLQRGTDRTVKNTYGLTPADLAQKKGYV